MSAPFRYRDLRPGDLFLLEEVMLLVRVVRRRHRVELTYLCTAPDGRIWLDDSGSPVDCAITVPDLSGRSL